MHIKNAIPLFAAIGLVAVFTAPSADSAHVATAQAAADANLATVKQYCVGCHNDKAKLGGVTFENLTPAAIAKDPALFEKAVKKLRGRVMPPPNAKQPEAKAVDSLVSWLEESLDKVPEPQQVSDQE